MDDLIFPVIKSKHLPAFEKLFNEIISFTDIFKISYEHYYGHYKEDEFINYRILSVNDCSSPEIFYDKVISLFDISIGKIKEFIITLDNTDKLAALNEVRRSLSYFKDITYQDEKVDNETIEWPEVRSPFYCFHKYSLLGTVEPFSNNHKQLILYNAGDFSLNWEEALKVSIGKIDSLINTIDHSSFLFDSNESKNENISTKFPTSLSVEELACFFRLLSDNGVITIPPLKKASFYRIIASNFSSKKQPDISAKSFKNHFESPSSATINSIHVLLTELVKAAKKAK